jgi:hypothetical protein
MTEQFTKKHFVCPYCLGDGKSLAGLLEILAGKEVITCPRCYGEGVVFEFKTRGIQDFMGKGWSPDDINKPEDCGW